MTASYFHCILFHYLRDCNGGGVACTRCTCFLFVILVSAVCPRRYKYISFRAP